MQSSFQATLEKVGSLSESAVSRDLGELMQFLGSDDWQTRRAAVDAMSTRLKRNGAVGSTARFFTELIEAATDKTQAGRRAAAIATLETIGKPAFPFLESELKVAPEHARIALVGIIGAAGGSAAVELLAPFARTEAEPNVAAAAITALGRTGEAAALSILLTNLQSTDDWLRFAAIGALGELGDERAIASLGPLLKDPLFEEAVAGALVDIGTVPALRVLSACLLNHDKTLRLPILSAMVALYSEERALPYEISEELRSSTKRLFRDVASKSVASELTALVSSGGPLMARCGVTALGWLGAPAAVSCIAVALADPALTKAGRLALSDLALEPEALRELTSMHGRIGAVDIAAAIQGVRSIAAIEAAVELMLSCTDPEVFESCANALSGAREWLSNVGRQGVKRRELSELREFLLRHLGTAEGRPLVEISTTLAALPGILPRNLVREILEILGVPGTTEREIARLYFLRRINVSAAVREALVAQRHRDSAVRVCAIEILGQHSDPQQASALIQHSTDEAVSVRRAAMRALAASVPVPKVLRTLRVAMQDRDIWVRAEALRTLGKVFRNDVAVYTELQEALSASHPLCRVAAVQALSVHIAAASDHLSDVEPRKKPRTVWRQLTELAQCDPQLEVRRVAVRAFLNCPDKSMACRVAARALEDGAWAVHHAAVEVLASVDSKRSTVLLFRVASDKSRDSSVRGIALRSLALREHSSVIGLACEALCSEDVTLVEAGFAALRLRALTEPEALTAAEKACTPRTASIVRAVLGSSQEVTLIRTDRQPQVSRLSVSSKN